MAGGACGGGGGGGGLMSAVRESLHPPALSPQRLLHVCFWLKVLGGEQEACLGVDLKFSLTCTGERGWGRGGRNVTFHYASAGYAWKPLWCHDGFPRLPSQSHLQATKKTHHRPRIYMRLFSFPVFRSEMWKTNELLSFIVSGKSVLVTDCISTRE